MPTSAAAGEGRPRIVTAEDNPVMAHVIGFNLRQAGYEVIAARNGQEAWTRFEQERVDLLITDYQMPILDGWELCQRVRQRWSAHQLPIILLSAKGLEIDGDRLVAEGYIQRIIFKPFSPRELVRAAGELIGRLAPAPV
jgi:CheY-like chemotaxis protein